MNPEKSVAQDEETGKAAKGGCSYGIATSFYLTFKFLFLYIAAAPSLPGGDDPSAKMWALSISQASEHDLAMAERWKNDMDGILIYV